MKKKPHSLSFVRAAGRGPLPATRAAACVAKSVPVAVFLTLALALSVRPALASPRRQNVAAAAAAASASSVTAPVLGRDIGRYAVFADHGMEWGGAVELPVSAALGVNTGGLSVSADTTLEGPQAYLAAPSVAIGGRSDINFVYANELRLADDAVVRSAAAVSYAAPLVAAVDYPRMPSFECGGDDVTVDAGNSPLTLPGGSYGVVTVTGGRKLELVPGAAYRMCSFRLRGDAEVEVHADNVVYVADYVSTGARAVMAGDDACNARWFARGDHLSPAPNSAAFDFGSGGPANRARIAGRFFTTSKIAMAQHNDYVGRFWADTLEAPAADNVTRTLSVCSGSYCGDGTVDPGEECDDGNNLDGDCCSAFCLVRAEGELCDDGSFCTGVDHCNGEGVCVGDGDPCAGADGDADCSESCNEASDSCTKADPDGAACDDGDACTQTGYCRSGVCRGEDPVDCDDGDLCTYDYCDPHAGACSNYFAPDPACHGLGDSFTHIELGFASSGKAKSAALISRWRSPKGGEATPPAELGNPLAGDEYALCIYDTEAADPQLVYRLDLSADVLGENAQWKRRETRSKLVYRLKAPDGGLQGVSKAKLMVDKDYAVSLSLRAGANPGCGPACRENFDPPQPAGADSVFAMDPLVTVQWASSTGACWSSEYARARSNTENEFRAAARR